MTLRNYYTIIFLACALIATAVIFRIIPHAPNMTPIGAIALVGAAYFSKRLAFISPMIAMIISDIIIGFHTTMPFVYGSFLLIGLLGMFVSTRRSFSNMFLSTVASSIIFFVITNFGVWIMGGYPQTWEGFVLCYTMAIPFFQNTILGDMLFVSLLVGVFEVSMFALPKYTQTELLTY